MLDRRQMIRLAATIPTDSGAAPEYSTITYTTYNEITFHNNEQSFNNFSIFVLQITVNVTQFTHVNIYFIIIYLFIH